MRLFLFPSLVLQKNMVSRRDMSVCYYDDWSSNVHSIFFVKLKKTVRKDDEESECGKNISPLF